MSRRRFASFYERRIFPWINDKLTSAPEVQRLRTEALAGARGRTIEIGFGGGANLPFYPPAVDEIVGVEPNRGMFRFGQRRARAHRVPVRLAIAEGEALPFAGDVFDTAVSTLTLCTVADPHAVLAELRRVLHDDGRLIVLEHGLAAEPSVARWQHRLNPVQNVVACGCNLNRPTRDVVEHAGFVFTAIRQFFLPGVPRPMGWFTVGTASVAAKRA
jgi:SAM-dependent methyltransferase